MSEREPLAEALVELAGIRDEIEALDRSLIDLVARRVALARRVGAVKRRASLPILDPPREAAVVRRAGSLAREAGIDDDEVRYLFWHLIGLSRRAQLEER